MKGLLTAATIMAALLCSGCAGSGVRLSDLFQSGPWWQAAQADGVAERARDWESRGELGLAMAHWRLVQAIANDPTEAGREINRLQMRIDESVRLHYRDGLRALKRKRRNAARNHFLTALRLDPTFQPALRQIRSRYATFPLAVYPVAAGETPASVARKVFEDEKKAVLVAWFNDLPPEGELRPGTLLLLPKLERQPVKPDQRVNPPDRLAEAREYLAEDDLDTALALARQADVTDPEVQSLIHTIHLQQAAEQIDADRLEAAEQFLAAIPDGFAGKAPVLQQLRSLQEQRQFDRDLADARDQFAKGNYIQSLARSDTLLEKRPDHPDLRRIAAESRYRVAQANVDSGRYLEAREVLAQADATHAASAALKEAVHERLVKMGQMHYRNGVKHFINEHLQAAIAEWEQALACDPDHAKARENIAIARRLQKKIETMP